MSFFLGQGSSSSRGQAPLRGFTLVELMVVVTIIGLLAAIAVPTLAERFRERRSAEAAQRIATLYRLARMRAMGRGSAVMVRYDSGAFNVVEAVRGTGACPNEPVTTCLNATSWRTVTSLDLPHRGEYEGVQVTGKDPTGNAASQLDVCYTPLGRSYARTNVASPLSPLTGVASFDVTRGTATLTRTVAVLPNGIARVAL